jgi:hypothetical protein
VEILVGLFCASAPALKALILSYSPKFLGTVMSSTRGGTSGRLPPEETMRTFGFSANKSFDGGDEERLGRAESFHLDVLEPGNRYDSEIRKSGGTRDSLQRFDFGFVPPHDFEVARPPSYQRYPPEYTQRDR